MVSASDRSKRVNLCVADNPNAAIVGGRAGQNVSGLRAILAGIIGTTVTD